MVAASGVVVLEEDLEGSQSTCTVMDSNSTSSCNAIILGKSIAAIGPLSLQGAQISVW